MSVRSTLILLIGCAVFGGLGVHPAHASPATRDTAAAGADVPVIEDLPAPVKSVPPVYPDAARRRKQEGTVFVQAYVGKNGKVSNARIPKGKGVAPDMDRAALDAIRKWEFKPAKSGGKAVACWVVIPIAFRLH